MKVLRPTGMVCLLSFILIFGAPAWSEEGDPAGPRLGKETFDKFCSVCHAPTGEGTPLGKSLISTDAKIKSDSRLLDTITNGIPGTAMSAYSSGLTPEEIFWTMIFVRELQGDVRVRGNSIEEAALPNLPTLSEQERKGEAIYNGKAECIHCHSYRTRGGLTGPDLTTIALEMTAEDIRSAVLQPNAHINPNFQTMELQLTDGTRVVGLFRHETVDHLQIANEDATLWRTYFRKDIAKMRQGRVSLMPADYDTRLTEEEQEQLFAFLNTLK